MSQNSKQWPWPDSLDALVAAPAHPKFPSAQSMQPLPPHTVENLGPLEITVLIIELKDY
ncbi:MAG TPA: hypothetical protein VIX14_07975 [Terriglobales bacterium]